MKKQRNSIINGIVLASVFLFAFSVNAEARPIPDFCFVMRGTPYVAGDYLMSFRYLLPDEPSGIEIRGTREARVSQCRNVLDVTISQPGSVPDEVSFRARINRFGEVSVPSLNFGLTGGSAEDVIVTDIVFALTERGNAYGTGFLDSSRSYYDGSRVLLIFEPVE